MRVQELGDERISRTVAQIGQRASLHDMARIHKHDLVAEVRGFREVVCDEDDGLLQLAEDALQILLQRGADKGIERAEGLIEQQQLRRKRESARIRLTR